MIPIVVERTINGERSFDIYSKLLKERIVFVTGEIDDELSKSVIAQLLFLEAEDAAKDIYVYINSPGGSVTAGLAIYDTIKFIKPDVSTICIGLAASMAAVLLSSGSRGKRYCLENAEVMIHQPLAGISGQATDIEIHASRIIRHKKLLTDILAKNTRNTVERIVSDTERDYFMTAKEALDYGLIDGIKMKIHG